MAPCQHSSGTPDERLVALDRRWRETVVTQRTKTRWSFAEDRRFIQLATSLKSVEAIATEMKRPPANVARTAKRLGISLKSGARLKAKGK
jgi:hypothetical protein